MTGRKVPVWQGSTEKTKAQNCGAEYYNYSELQPSLMRVRAVI
jgi:hypothetical protein